MPIRHLNLHILLVEDDPDHADLIAMQIQNRAGNVTLAKAASLADACRQLAETDFDAILLDLNLPDAAGPQHVVDTVKGASRAALVVLTSLDDEEMALAMMRDGVQDYLVKGRDGSEVLLRSVRYSVERKRIEEAMRAGEERLELAMAGSNAGFWDIGYDPETGQRTSVFFSPRQKEIIGFHADEFPDSAEAWEKRIHPDDLAQALATRDEFVHQHQTARFEVEYRILHRDGTYRWVQSRGDIQRDRSGQPMRWSGIVWDITEHKRHLETRSRLAAIVESTDDAIFSLDLDGQIRDWNAGACTIYGYAPEEAIGLHVTELVPRKSHRSVSEAISALQDGKRIQQLESLHVRQDGTLFYAAMTMSPVYDEQSRLTGLSGIVRDITERKEFEEHLHFSAFHDRLTGLPNRALFVDRLEHVITRASRHSRPYAAMVVDMDNFKVVNDSLGHLAGDRLLVMFAERLQQCLRPEDTLARFGGDEFTILLEEADNWDMVNQIACRIQDAMRQPFVLDDREVYTGASVGVALCDGTYLDSDAVLRDADTALYRAKNRGKSCHVIFDHGMRQEAVTRLKLETDLRRAIADNSLGVHYQPIMDVENNKIIGCEALARWHHPEFHDIAPETFIPLAEETGLILQLGQQIFAQACGEFAQWYHSGQVDRDFYLSINLSVKQFMHTALPKEVAVLLHDLQIPGKNLRLEITETVLMESTGEIESVFEQLKSLGIRLCMDDFGTGYSSLSCLHRFPVDVLKIDRSFIRDLDGDPASRQILTTMMSLANNLNMEAVAEGAESAAHLKDLREMGFRWVQGFVYHEAKSFDDFSSLLAGEREPLSVGVN